MALIRALSGSSGGGGVNLDIIYTFYNSNSYGGGVIPSISTSSKAEKVKAILNGTIYLINVNPNTGKVDNTTMWKSTDLTNWSVESGYSWNITNNQIAFNAPWSSQSSTSVQWIYSLEY